jgi:hypothetical protein
MGYISDKEKSGNVYDYFSDWNVNQEERGCGEKVDVAELEADYLIYQILWEKEKK